MIASGVLRVGVSENPPWVVRSPSGSPTGPEVQLVMLLAREQHARVEWEWNQLESLFCALEKFELDLAVAGIDDGTPWEERVGLRGPWAVTGRRRLVLALPPGENRWMGTVDRFLHSHAGALRDLARRVQR